MLRKSLLLTGTLTLALAGGVVAAAGKPRPAPVIEIQPRDTVLLGDPVTVRMTGLPAGATVTLRARILDPQGTIWESHAGFRADVRGVVDVGRDAPVSGTYSGVDRLGMFWSMQEIEGQAGSRQARDSERAVSTVLFEAVVDGRVVAEKVHRRILRRKAVTVTEVRDVGLVGTLYHPDGVTPSPGIVVIGGSGGGIGWQKAMAELLSAHGYAALALAYFGMEGLPDSLERIPLEYCGRAIDWMDRSDLVKKKRLAVMGVSKGAELALLLGTRFPAVGAVIAYVPSSVVFQSLAPGYPRTSSWTYEEREMAYVPYLITERYRASGQLVDLYEDSLMNRVAAEAASIPVERIGGPILLLSGQDDTLWPSTQMAGEVMKRLRKNKHPFTDRHFAYSDAGHFIARYPYFPSAGSTRRGGTEQGNARAQADSWEKVLGFLKDYL
jgi:dienelactone hydrolase